MKIIRYSFQILNKIKIFTDDFRKSIQIPNFMKISPVEAELFLADEETDT